MRPTAATRVSARTAGGFTHGRAIVCRGRGRRRRAGRWAREHQPSSRRALYLDSAEMWRCARPLRYIARPAPCPTPLQAVSPRPLPFHSLFFLEPVTLSFLVVAVARPHFALQRGSGVCHRGWQAVFMPRIGYSSRTAGRFRQVVSCLRLPFSSSWLTWSYRRVTRGRLLES